MKTEYKAGDLSKLLASTSPKAATPSSKPSPGKNVFSDKKNKKARESILDKSFAKGEMNTPKNKVMSPNGNVKLGDDSGSKKVGALGSNKKGSNKKKSKVTTEDSVNKNVGQARKSIAGNFSPSVMKEKQDIVKKNVEKQDNSERSPDKQGKKKKKKRHSFGFYRRLERKKEEKQKRSKGKKSVDEETKAENGSSPNTPKMKQDDMEKDAVETPVSKNRKRKNVSSAAGPEPNIKKVKVQDKLDSDSDSDDDSGSSDSTSSDDDSDVHSVEDEVKTKMVKNTATASDESSGSDGEKEKEDDDSNDDDDSDDDDDDSDEESEDDLSYKRDTNMMDEEKALDSDSSDDDDDEAEDEEDDDSSEASDRENVHKGGNSAGFCPPEGIVHESLKKKGEKRKPASDSSDEDMVPSKKMKSDDAETDKGTRPRKDRLAKATNDRTIFVGNLPNSTTKKQLERLFKTFGEIESSRFRTVPVKDPKLPKRAVAITRDFHPQRNNFNAYVCFEEDESAKKALSMNGTEVDGLHIRVDMVGRQTQKDPKKSIFVGNLPLDIEEEALRKHFDDCGEIENVRVVRDKKISLGKGFGFVTFKESDGVSFALKLTESKLNGRKLRIEKCAEGKKSKKKSDKAAKNKQPSNTTNPDEEGSPKPKSDKLKKKKKKKNKVTPSNVSKNPFQEEKDQSEMMKQKAKREKAEKKLQGSNALKNDIEKIMNEGKAEAEKNKEGSKQTPKSKKFGDKSFTKQNERDFGGKNKGDNFAQKSKKFDDSFNKEKSGDFGKNKVDSQTPKHKKFGEDNSSGTKSPKKFEKKGGFQKEGFNKNKKFDNNKDFKKSPNSPNKSFGTQGSKFGKDGNTGFKKFEKKPFPKGQNSPNRSFEKKGGNFGKNPGFNKKNFDSPVITSSGGKGKHVKFD
ncbi:uncharacterized protein LOC128559108 [Mercenaria mercenaria]|uniref:uncharacterized protein LOC128559108 n=1 Tax=Mercenaria mercenaria TaxID=6596 RepID=UPI00234F70D6|nr:uncharacterized protein LOC128559108 [Mercenaria mercenaria]